MGQRYPVTNILLVVDSTESGLKAAQYAIDLAKSTGASLTAASVVDTETLKQLLTKRILVSVEMEELEHDLEDSGRKYIDEVSSKQQATSIGLYMPLLYHPVQARHYIVEVSGHNQVPALVYKVHCTRFKSDTWPTLERSRPYMHL